MYTISDAVLARAERTYLGDVTTPDGRVLTRYNSSHELRSYYRHRDRIRARQREYRERVKVAKRKRIEASKLVAEFLSIAWTLKAWRRRQQRLYNRKKHGWNARTTNPVKRDAEYMRAYWRRRYYLNHAENKARARYRAARARNASKIAVDIVLRLAA